MLNDLLLCRTARSSSRGGFTLVELLVVIGIIAILAGVALGPITNGIKQAKHNASMQTGRQIGQIFFSFSTDNTVNGNAYPADTTAAATAQDLLNASYVTDPSVFIVSGQTGIIVAPVSGTAVSMATSNISWCFTAQTAGTNGGITSTTSDLIPLIYFNNGVTTAPTGTFFPAGGGTAKTCGLLAGAPFGTDGIGVFYKGNNAAYLKAGTSGTVGAVANFISADCLDTTTYVIIQ